MRRFGKLLLVTGMMFLLTAPQAMAAETISAYMGLSPEVNKQLVQLIKERTGITVNQTFQSFGEIEAKVKAEAPHFNADICAAVGSPLAFMAKKNGWSVPYPSPTWSDVDPVFADPQGFWVNTANFSFVLVGNKNRLATKGQKLPTSWKELLDPKWKGEIVMASPLSSGTANQIRYTFLALYGDEEGWKFLEGLDKNIAFYTRSGNAPIQLVSRGEFTLGINADDSVANLIAQGYPVVWGIPEEGTGYDGCFAFILKGTKKMDAARKVIDFLGTQEASQLLADYGYMPPRPANNKLYGKKPPKYIPIDLGKAAEDKNKNNDIWKSRFRTDFK